MSLKYKNIWSLFHNMKNHALNKKENEYCHDPKFLDR